MNVKLVPVLGATFPVAAVENKTLQDVSDDSSAAVTDRQVVAVATILLVNVDTPLTLSPVLNVERPVTSKPPAAISIPLPPLTNTPALAVIIPITSILVTSSYVNVQPTETFSPTCKLPAIPTPPDTTLSLIHI